RRGGPLVSGSSSGGAFPLRLTFSPDGQTLSEVIPPRLFLWDVAQPQQPRTPNVPCTYVGFMAFKKDGKTFIAASHSSEVLLGSVATEEWRRLPLSASSGPIVSDPANKTVATAIHSGILLWDVESGEQLKQLDIRTTHGQPLALSPNGQMLAQANDDG